MKKLFILGIVTIILLSSIPISASSYNDGPEPTKNHYTNFKYNVVGSEWNGAKYVEFRSTYDVWIYSDTNDLKLSTIEQDGFIRNIYVSTIDNAESNIKIYITSSSNESKPMDISNTLKNSFFKEPLDYVSANHSKYINDVLSSINDGQYSYNYTFYGVDTKLEFEMLANNITYFIEDEIAIYPQALVPIYEDTGFIRILSPINNFKQSGSLPYWSITVYYNVPVSESSSIQDWSITPISETIKGVKVTSHDVKKIGVYPYEYYSGTMTATYSVPIGVHDIAFSMKNKLTGKTYLSSVYTYTNLEGFEDNDGDGKDDRTGLPDTGYIDDGWLDDGTNNGYLPIEEWSMSTLFSNIGALLNNFKVSVSSLLTQITDMTSIFSVLTSVLPSEIVALLTASILLFVILKVFHR